MIRIHNCLRCGHEWPSKIERLPKVCPKCKSPYWNKTKWKGIKEEECEGAFEYIRSNVESWKFVAGILVKAAHKFEVDEDGYKNEAVLYPFVDVYNMLVAYALENYYKGVIEARMSKNGKAKTGELMSDKKHNLRRLAIDAGIDLNDEQLSYLDQLSESALWKGRYPLALNPQNVNRSMSKQGKCVVVDMDSIFIPIEATHALIKQARMNLNNFKSTEPK